MGSVYTSVGLAGEREIWPLELDRRSLLGMPASRPPSRGVKTLGRSSLAWDSPRTERELPQGPFYITLGTLVSYLSMPSEFSYWSL